MPDHTHLGAVSPDALEAPSPVPEPMLRALRSELDEGERIRWCDQPEPGRAFRAVVVGSLLGAVVFLLAAAGSAWGSWLAWQDMQAINQPPQWFRPGERPSLAPIIILGLGSVLFCGLTVACVLGPTLAAKKAKRTIFALTQTRIMRVEVCEGAVFVDALEPGHPLRLARFQRDDGFGEVRVYPTPDRGGASMRISHIRDPRKLERLIRLTFDPVLPSGLEVAEK